MTQLDLEFYILDGKWRMMGSDARWEVTQRYESDGKWRMMGSDARWEVTPTEIDDYDDSIIVLYGWDDSKTVRYVLWLTTLL